MSAQAAQLEKRKCLCLCGEYHSRADVIESNSIDNFKKFCEIIFDSDTARVKIAQFIKRSAKAKKCTVYVGKIHLVGTSLEQKIESRPKRTVGRARRRICTLTVFTVLKLAKLAFVLFCFFFFFFFSGREDTW